MRLLRSQRRRFQHPFVGIGQPEALPQAHIAAPALGQHLTQTQLPGVQFTAGIRSHALDILAIAWAAIQAVVYPLLARAEAQAGAGPQRALPFTEQPVMALSRA